MAHYAFLDENNIVVEVITGNEPNSEGINWEEWYGNFRGMTCKRTSYNTYAGVHTNPNKEQFRYNYAGIGYTFDATKGTHGAFIPPKPFPSWVLDASSCTWKSPVPRPADTNLSFNEWDWDEATTSWVAITQPIPENPQP
jgi:hypothetical protein